MLEAVPRELFAVPRIDKGYRAFVAGMSRMPWAMPYVCLEGGNAAAVCFLNVPQPKHLSAFLVALLARPSEAGLPLALYIRHAFWSYPLHRLFTHVPALPDSEPYRDALLGIGFKREGVLDVAYTDAAKAAHRTVPRGAAPLQLVWTVIGVALFVAVLVLVRDHRRLQSYTYTAMVVGLLRDEFMSWCAINEPSLQLP